MRYVLLIIFLLFLPLVQALPVVNSGEVYLWPPYEEHSVYAWTALDYGQYYNVSVNGQVVHEGNTSSLLVLPFDSRLEGLGGEQANSSEGVSFEPGLFGEALRGRAWYNTSGNLNISRGSMDIWLSVTEPLDSQLFNNSNGGDGYIAGFRNSELNESFYFYVRARSANVAFVVFNGNWSQAVQAGTPGISLDWTRPHLLSFSWDEAQNETQFFVDGFKFYEGKYDFYLTPLEEFFVGNPHVLIHDFRIRDKVSTETQTMEQYRRGLPFSAQDIELDMDVDSGDSLEIQWDGGDVLDVVSQSPINVLQPDSSVMMNEKHLNISVYSRLAECRYSDHAQLYEDMITMDISEGYHVYSILVDSVIDPFNIHIKCGDDDAATRVRTRMYPPLDNNYPKTFNIYWGVSVNESNMEPLSRYDMIGVGSGYFFRPDRVRGIKEYREDVLVTYYDNLIAVSPHYEFNEEDFYERIGDEWRLQNTSGHYAWNPSFPKNLMYNLWQELNYSEELSTQATHIMEYGYYDGVWYDNAGSSFWFLKDYDAIGTPYVMYPDIDLDGDEENLDDPVDHAKARQLWADGIGELIQLTRDKMGPSTLVMGNAADHYPEHYNGKLWEEEMSRTYYGLELDDFLDNSGTDPYDARHSFLYWQNHTTEPKLNQNLYGNNYAEGSSSFYRSHRYGLSASTIGGVYYGTAKNAERSYFWWFDEYLVNVTSGEDVMDESARGWLGEPIAQPVKLLDNVYLREFENGIVVANGRTTSETINLGGYYRKILGSQDSFNDGGLADSITLNSRDGALLIRPLCEDNPGDDSRCIRVPCAMFGDVNCDGYVSFADFLYVASHYGETGNDLNGDGVLTLADMAILGRIL